MNLMVTNAGFYSHISTLADVHEHVQVRPPAVVIINNANNTNFTHTNLSVSNEFSQQ